VALGAGERRDDRRGVVSQFGRRPAVGERDPTLGRVAVGSPPVTVPVPVPVPRDEATALAAALGYAESIAPGAVERDRAGVAPRAELAAFDATGLLAITVPQDDGGPGLGPGVLTEVARTLAAADPSVAQTPQAHYLFVDGAVLLGSLELRERLFADVLAGQRIGNGLAEREPSTPRTCRRG
jgi:alkylation response protein AidB-like acyl-CoA dehydrogenase